MADETQKSTEDKTPLHRPNASQLEYPRLLIEASFQSLLSHSQSSGTRTIVTMPMSEHALSESWSSLSEHDLIHDDDLTSDPTDTGSLIDVSATEDVRSVDEAGSSGESEDDSDHEQDQRNSWTADDGTRAMENQYGTHISPRQYQNAHAYTAESIRLDDSTAVIDSGGVTSLHASKTLHDAEITPRFTEVGSDEIFDDIFITIKMSMSPESLKLSQQPYNILYYGSSSTSAEIRADVLSKIGAALISSGESATVDDRADSPCYHVIPSEFGPGSKPSTADLIPIPTQMHVTNCTVIGTQPDNSSGEDIQLQLSTGKIVTSQSRRFGEKSSHKQWTKPDLAVIVVSQRDDFKDRAQAEKVAKFATRHGIPLLCLRQENDWDGDSFLTDLDPDMLHEIVHFPFEYRQGKAGQKMLIDVDTFRLLDTEQLSQHINYLTASAMRSINSSPPQGDTFVRTIQTCCRYLAKVLPQRIIQRAMLRGESPDASTWVVKSTVSPVVDKYVRTTKTSGEAAGLDTREFDFLLIAMRRVAMVFAATLLTVMTYHACQTILPHYQPGRFLSSNRLPEQVSVTEAPCMRSPLPLMTSTSTSTQTFALSGPLQAIEQQVQSWVPVNRCGRKDKKQSVEPRSKDYNVEKKDNRACSDLASSHFSPTLKLETAFFESGQPAFEVQVQRDAKKIDSITESQTDGTAAVMIKREDLHGRLTVHLQGKTSHVCATIDLQDSLSEAFTHWIKSLHDENKKTKTAKELANRYTRLLEIRTTRPGLVNTALELHYSAAQGIGAVVEAVEKSAVRRARACQQDRNQCFAPVSQLQFTKEISESIQHGRQMSEDLIQSTHDQVVETTRQVRHRANEITQLAVDEAVKAIQVVQSSMEELSILGKTWPGKVSRTLTRAQQHAQKLVKKPRKES